MDPVHRNVLWGLSATANYHIVVRRVTGHINLGAGGKGGKSGEIQFRYKFYFIRNPAYIQKRLFVFTGNQSTWDKNTELHKQA